MEEEKKLAEKILKELNIRYSFFTCDKCGRKDECEYAYDAYNIDGDCLAEK